MPSLLNPRIVTQVGRAIEHVPTFDVVTSEMVQGIACGDDGYFRLSAGLLSAGLSISMAGPYTITGSATEVTDGFYAGVIELVGSDPDEGCAEMIYGSWPLYLLVNHRVYFSRNEIRYSAFGEPDIPFRLTVKVEVKYMLGFYKYFVFQRYANNEDQVTVSIQDILHAEIERYRNRDDQTDLDSQWQSYACRFLIRRFQIMSQQLNPSTFAPDGEEVLGMEGVVIYGGLAWTGWDNPTLTELGSRPLILNPFDQGAFNTTNLFRTSSWFLTPESYIYLYALLPAGPAPFYAYGNAGDYDIGAPGYGDSTTPEVLTLARFKTPVLGSLDLGNKVRVGVELPTDIWPDQYFEIGLNVDAQHYAEHRQLVYRSSLGSLQVLPLVGAYTDELDSNRQMAETGVAIARQQGDSARLMYGHLPRLTLRLNTGYRHADQIAVLAKELTITPEAYLQQGDGYWPVIINSKSFKVTESGTFLRNLSLEVEQAFDFISC